MDDRQFWLLVRQALLLFIDAIERRYCIAPRTAEMRRADRFQLEGRYPSE